ncbi:MAG: class I SAM-dependent methyltransferase [Opitutaceae bacterium]|nr:class I SAM-dependent methyltransferase [Opitutaceae bacterium]
MNSTTHVIIPRITAAIRARRTPSLGKTKQAFRLFNGFTEGFPGVTVDLYGETLVIDEHSTEDLPWLEQLIEFYRRNIPSIRAVLLKRRKAKTPEERRGTLLLGTHLNTTVTENNIFYAINLTLNQDCSFYCDTRNLRRWLFLNAKGKRVLNCFAYTGSLGIAAIAGQAKEVVQTDKSSRFLKVANSSSNLNKFPSQAQKLLAGDFFKRIAFLKKQKALFDYIILDPPFFSSTQHGKVDLGKEYIRLINKVRPLIADNGKLIAINNALFLSGADYMQSLEELCKDGYLSIQETIPAPQDCIGYPETICEQPPVDPTPFNHPTKIAILQVTRKDSAI